MLNPLPARGTRVWGNDVATINGEFVFVPREVTFLYKDRGLVWFSHDVNPKPNENGWGWYSDSFFYTKEESQSECDLLNREAKGEKVRSSLVAHDIGVALKASETRGPVHIC